MDLDSNMDSRIQKVKDSMEEDDIKFPVTEFDPDGTFLDASLFPHGLTKTEHGKIKEGVVKRDMDKIERMREVGTRNKEFASRLRDENDDFQKFQELQKNQKMTERNKPDASQTPPQLESEPQPVDISTYKCTALKEITNHLWENKDKKEYTELIIDLLYSISNSEDIEKIKKIVKMYRTQTGQGKRKKKNTKKRGGKRVNKKRVNKKKK